MNLVVDTNVILRFLLNDIPSQVSQFEQKIEQAKQGKVRLFIPQIVIFEIDFALRRSYGFNKEKVAKNLKKIVSLNYLEVDGRDIFIEALKLYEEKNLSLPDCFVKAYAKLIGFELFTFDKNLKKEAERADLN